MMPIGGSSAETVSLCVHNPLIGRYEYRSETSHSRTKRLRPSVETAWIIPRDSILPGCVKAGPEIRLFGKIRVAVQQAPHLLALLESGRAAVKLVAAARPTPLYMKFRPAYRCNITVTGNPLAAFYPLRGGDDCKIGQLIWSTCQKYFWS